jgi:DEAD/DEAH box helicase domain-containing protein
MAPGARISPYRAGYLPAERRDIERRLRAGELHAVVSTDALELGIDIGGLDAVVLAGYPGTVAATWQQIGRAGRAGRPALAVLVAGQDPIDAYLARRPATLFGAPVERAVVALANPVVLAGQVLCAAAEAPVVAADAARFGPALAATLDGLRAEGLVAPVGAGDGFVGTFRPASVVRLDGRADDAVELRAGGALVEVLERWRAMRQAHAGAVLLHRGQALRVTDLDLGAGVATAEPYAGPEHTRATVVRDHRVGEPERTGRAGSWALALGPADIRSQVTAYKRCRGDEVLATHPLELPAVTLHTRALWLRPDGGLAAVRAMVGDRSDPLAALHAAEHALIHALALLAMGDRQDTGGASTLVDPAAGQPLILLYDGLPGGSGVVDAAAERLGELAALATEMLASCDCDTGCPRCVYDRDCGSGNTDLDRHGAMAVLASLDGHR